MSRHYKLLSSQDVELLWARWQQGDAPVQIGARLGCSRATVTWHLDRGGGVRPRPRTGSAARPRR